jgi:hypothetical protein
MMSLWPTWVPDYWSVPPYAHAENQPYPDIPWGASPGPCPHLMIKEINTQATVWKAVELATRKDSKALSLPGIAFIDSSVSARCCHLLQKESDRTMYGNVTTATALEERTMAFSDLINETMSQSCNVYKYTSLHPYWFGRGKQTSFQSLLTLPKYPHCGAQSDCIAILPAFRFPPSFLNVENTRDVYKKYKKMQEFQFCGY